MELAVITGLLRLVFSAYAGNLMTQGVITDDFILGVSGVALLVLNALWSYIRNSKYFPKVEV